LNPGETFRRDFFFASVSGFCYIWLSLKNQPLIIIPNQMKKSAYKVPLADVSLLKTETIICASNGGSTEDFGNGTGFSFDLFESVKPF